MTSTAGTAAHEAGLGAGARLLCSAPSSRAAQRRAVPVRALYLAVPSHPGCASAVPLAHARAAVACTRGTHVTSIVVPRTWSGLGGWSPPLELCTVASRGLASHHTVALTLSYRPFPLWLCSSRASSARPRCCGMHVRSARDLHRGGHSAWSELGGWRPPPELGVLASRCPATRRTGACALSCHAVPTWQCSSRASSASTRCCGSHASSAHDLHRWDRSARSGPGGWRPLVDISTVVSRSSASRRTSARALSCRAVPLWLCFSRASSARPRCCGIHARSARDLHR